MSTNIIGFPHGALDLTREQGEGGRMMQDLLDELPPPQRLALSYAPAASRAPLLAMLVLDARLAMIVRRRKEIVLAQMRIAWWRDMLNRPAAQWPHGDPVLELLRDWGDPASLAPLADGWECLLDDLLGPGAIDGFVAGRANAWVGLARELGLSAEGDIRLAARHWALADLAANISDPGERALISGLARNLEPLPKLPRAVRPLAVLAALGERSLSQGVPLLAGGGSVLCALRVGLLGR